MAVDVSSMPATDRDAAGRRLLDGFLARTPRSQERHEAAKRVMPGGDTRTVAFHPPYPLTIGADRDTSSSILMGIATSIS